MINVSVENYTQFYKEWGEGKFRGCRLGQAFYNFMKLEKITGHAKPWCDRLWNADVQEAFSMIQASIDYDDSYEGPEYQKFVSKLYQDTFNSKPQP